MNGRPAGGVRAVRRLGSILVLVALLAGACASAASPSTAGPTATRSAPVPPASHAFSTEKPTSTSPGPSPSVAPSSLAWHRLATIEGPVDEVIGFERGYIALDSHAGAVGYSADGKAWRAVTLPLRVPFASARDQNGRLGRALATNGHEILVVGGYAHAPCSTPSPGEADTTGGPPSCAISPLAWISDDGVRWRSAQAVSQAPAWSEFVAAWPARYGGWDAALSSWAGVDLGGQVIWHSADGVTWAPSQRTPPASWEGYDRVPLPITDGSGRVILVASRRDSPVSRVLVSTTDGLWTDLTGFPTERAWVLAGSGPPMSGGRWVLAGYTTHDQADFTPTIWTSVDLVRWTSTSLPVGRATPGPWLDSTGLWVNGLARGGDEYIAVGANMTTDGATHETWLSTDGSTWRLLPALERPAFDYGPALLAAGPAGLIGIGLDPDHPDRSSAVWQLR